MSRFHAVRLGAVANIGRFWSPEGVAYPRGARVVVRTDRGLETGETLSSLDEMSRSQADGVILRKMTVEDDLLEARLKKNRDEAYQACADRIAELKLPVVLMDVEHLFDGESLFFYFLGDVTPELERMTRELAELYDTKVRFREFAEAVAVGCGPDCGTDAAEGGGCGSCSVTCSLSATCSSK
ncbi:MAG: PSP1 domain-containing protein [Pirellulales bacterium]|nr:PSP1 domain-containing protein [Pirellulales bacterium]